MGSGFLKFLFGVSVFFSCHTVWAKTSSLSTVLTPEEEDNLQTRINRFYQSTDPIVMNQRAPKYDVVHGKPRIKKSIFELDQSVGNTLMNSAGLKLSASYTKERSQWIKQRFQLDNQEEYWSSVEPSDKIEDLTETYINKDEVNHSLDRLPVKGEISGDYWSGDYWSMNWGLTSYRYSSGKKFKLYKNAVASYSQPEEWFQISEILSSEKLSKVVELWSPAEKYDLVVGDSKFTLTREQKSEGAGLVQKNGQVEGWFGICDGWSPASIFVPSPKRVVKSIGNGGVEITWLPDDIRALASLAWTNGNYSHNLVGRRCETTNPRTYKNGRLSEVDCADTNPATFHFALGNLIGIQGVPFIMDATFDAEVWNQPVLAYEIKFFNPSNPKLKSQNYRQVMVPYDDHFKRRDRFQKPLTRGYRKQKDYFDGGIKAIVGVQATVVYLMEYQAEFDLQPHDNVTERVTYTYDLELHERNGELIPMGGEWHENTHPDFLWVPQKGAVAWEKWDYNSSQIDLSSMPTSVLTETAKKASKEGYPVCTVIEALVNASSESSSYRCLK